MTAPWFADAVVYSLDVKTFQDSGGDGVGDFPGLTSRLPYLAGLGVNCLWLAPFFPSPLRHDGYDVADFTAVDPRLGTLADLRACLAEARRLGLRVVADLEVNHTSDQHPWFQAARSDRRSPLRDYYLWADQEPADSREGVVFPGPQDRTWTFDAAAGAYYHHRFYHHMPDLHTGNPAVRAEVCRVVRFWAGQGFDGFRIDAAPFLLEHRPDTGELVTEFDELEEVGVPNPYGFLDELRQAAAATRPDAVLLAEANVDPDDMGDYFGPAASRMQVLFNFVLCEYAVLALVREQAAPLAEGWAKVPAPPPGGRWLNFLRNHDELNLGRLPEADKQAVFAALAPDDGMRVYGRGIRRRLAPMLGGDRRRLELAYSLLFALPGIPMLRYGDEIGMGDDLALEERLAVRTPMQWDDTPAGGFSTAPPGRLIRPVVDGEYGPARVNAADQDRDPGSLLAWFRRLIAARKACPALADGTGEPFDAGHPAVFGMRTRTATGTVVSLHNLSAGPVDVEPAEAAGLDLVFANDPAGGRRLGGYGYRWLRGR